MPARKMAGPFLVELYLIVDSKMSAMYGGNGYDKLLSRVTTILNQVNVAFMQFNIYFTVVQLEIWEQDLIKLTDENHIIMELQLYKRRFIDKKHDCLHAILGENLGSAKRGQSELASMCAYNRCVGYTKNYWGLKEIEIAHSVIHEIGHNFGLTHDTEQCRCFGCIMSTGVEFGNLKYQWSICSRKEMFSLLKSGMADCLTDGPGTKLGDLPPVVMTRNEMRRPLDTVMMPECGNGVVDEGEQCDCGGSALCSEEAKRCCNPDQCTLRAFSYCASGACCDVSRCAFKSACTVCRSVDDRDCDLPEFCNGLSEWCPSDVYKHDGTPCLTSVVKDASHCYRGQCQSRQSWCRVLYGDTATDASAGCYELNRIGDDVKNCGLKVPEKEDRSRRPKNWENRACQDEDVRCGRLWCSHSNERVIRSSPQMVVEETVEGHECSAARFYLDWFLDDAGLVPNGTPCGPGKMCQRGECVPPMKYIDIPGCFCHNHGVCNNHKNCHCDPGFAPPNCTDIGNGGSVNSGTPCQFHRNSTMIVAGIFIGIIVILTIFVIATLLYHFRTRKWPFCLAFIKWPEYQKPEFLVKSMEPNKFGRQDSKFIRCSINQFDKVPGSPKSPMAMFSNNVFRESMFVEKPILLPKNRRPLIPDNQSEKKPLHLENPRMQPPKLLCDKPSKTINNPMKPPVSTDKPAKAANVSEIASRFNESVKPQPLKPPVLSAKPIKSSVTKKPTLLSPQSEKPKVTPSAPMILSEKPGKSTVQDPSCVTDKVITLSKTPLKTKFGHVQISQPRLDQTTCDTVTRELSSPDQTLARHVVPHKLIKVNPNVAVKYLY